MEKFLKKLKYNIIDIFAHLIMLIGYIVVSYPLWGIIFFRNPAISGITYFIVFIIGFVITITGSLIREDNEENYNKPD
jgi:protein-S-isoprenylcysteine O-methyltransferase Ste14